MNKVGISGFGVYVPPYRVRLEDWCDWTGASWEKISRVVGNSFRIPGPRESSYTMAATAVLRLIRQYDIDPSRVGFLGFGTESSTDNSAGPIIIKGMLDRQLRREGRPPLSRGCEVPEFKHACLGGVYAMKGALRYLALDGCGKQAIVVCADIAEYARGSSGEPTQGAGAVAMLVESEPTLVEVPLEQSGSASDYRGIDFRKPMSRFCGQDPGVARIKDFPVFNGKYSTSCYIDETMRALDDMYEKRGLDPARYLQSLRHIFMHRPYRRMPETALGYAYLAALAAGGTESLAELDTIAADAGIDAAALRAELRQRGDVASQATVERVNAEPYPLAAAALHAFRNSRAFSEQVLDKLHLGNDSNAELGNLYTAALPAWLAAGFEVALTNGIDLDGQELLTMGYGSGDAAEVIPFYVTDGWQMAAEKIRFDAAMDGSVDVSQQQYMALHDGVNCELPAIEASTFFIDHVGTANERHFCDQGIEYYGFSGARA